MRRDDHSSRRQKRTRGQRPRTISVSLSDRGQTTQDFAIGIGVFLLSVAFVFSYLPSLTTPFDSSVGGAEAAQADRIADRVVDDFSDSERPNKITDEDFFSSDIDEDGAKDLGLRVSDGTTFDHVSIRLETLDGTVLEDEDESTLVAETTAYEGQSAASSARIITLGDEFKLENHDDESAYRLVVRVW